jgi:hypothetical protein
MPGALASPPEMTPPDSSVGCALGRNGPCLSDRYSSLFGGTLSLRGAPPRMFTWLRERWHWVTFEADSRDDNTGGWVDGRTVCFLFLIGCVGWLDTEHMTTL